MNVFVFGSNLEIPSLVLSQRKPSESSRMARMVLLASPARKLPAQREVRRLERFYSTYAGSFIFRFVFPKIGDKMVNSSADANREGRLTVQLQG